MNNKGIFNRSNFILLWNGQLLTQLCGNILIVSMTFWLKHETESATLIGLLMAAVTLPAVLLSPLGGAVADLVSRKKILVLCDTLNGISILTFAFLMFNSVSTETTIIVVFIVAMIYGTTSAFFNPALLSLIPDITKPGDISKANSLIESTKQIAMLVGQGTGAILYRLFGTPVIALVNGIIFLISALLENLIKVSPSKAIVEEGNKLSTKQLAGNIKEGFVYVMSVPGLRNVFFTTAVINFFLAPILMLLPFYIEDTMKLSADWFGSMMVALSLGVMGGYILAGVAKVPAKYRDKAIFASLMILSGSFGALGVVNNITFALVAISFAGLMSGYVSINFLTLMQTNTENHLRGRVFGYLTTLTGGLAPLAAALSGIIADALDKNISLIYISCGVITAIFTILVSFNSDYRSFITSDTEKDSDSDSDSDIEPDAETQPSLS